jgi:ankyrin repeat protein
MKITLPLWKLSTILILQILAAKKGEPIDLGSPNRQLRLYFLLTGEDECSESECAKGLNSLLGDISVKAVLSAFVKDNLALFTKIMKKNIIDREYGVIMAARFASFNIMRHLIEQGVDVNLRNPSGQPLLTLSILHRQEDVYGQWKKRSRVATALLSAKANVNAQDALGLTPLMSAIQSGTHLSLVELLLKSGADVFLECQGGLSSRDYAESLGDATYQKAYLEMLIQLGFDEPEVAETLNQKDLSPYLSLPFWRMPAESIQKLVTIDELRTINFGSSRFIKNEIIAPLIPDNRVPVDKASAKIKSIFSNKSVSAMIDIFKTDDCGRMEKLLAKGVVDESHMLIMSATFGSKSILTMLLERGGNITIVDADGWTMLMAAIRSENMMIINYLIELGCDIHAVNFLGRSAFMLAALYQNRELVEFLISLGADTSAMCIHDKTALDYALAGGDRVIIGRLLIIRAQKLSAKMGKVIYTRILGSSEEYFVLVSDEGVTFTPQGGMMPSKKDNLMLGYNINDCHDRLSGPVAIGQGSDGQFHEIHKGDTDSFYWGPDFGRDTLLSKSMDLDSIMVKTKGNTTVYFQNKKMIGERRYGPSWSIDVAQILESEILNINQHSVSISKDANMLLCAGGLSVNDEGALEGIYFQGVNASYDLFSTFSDDSVVSVDIIATSQKNLLIAARNETESIVKVMQFLTKEMLDVT